MKMFNSILILITATFFSCNSQRNLFGEKTENKFLEWIIMQQNEEKISRAPIPLTIEKFLSLKGEINIGQKDSIDISNQIKANNKITFGFNLPGAKSFINTLSKEDSYLQITHPIFFDNDKKIWIHMNHFCPGKCGSEETQIYEVTPDGYKKLFEIGVFRNLEETG